MASRCSSTDVKLKIRKPPTLCPVGSTLEGECCVLTSKRGLTRPRDVEGVLKSTNGDIASVSKIKELLVEGDYNLSDNASLDRGFWDSLRTKHVSIARAILYGNKCKVPDEFIEEVYNEGVIDSIKCFVKYIVNSVSNTTNQSKIAQFVNETLVPMVQNEATASTITEIMENEGVTAVEHPSVRHKMVFYGVHNIIPTKCDKQDTVFLCIGLIVNRILIPNNTDLVEFPYDLSQPSMQLLLQYAKNFPRLHLKDSNPLVVKFEPNDKQVDNEVDDEADDEVDHGEIKDLVELCAERSTPAPATLSTDVLNSVVTTVQILKLRNCDIHLTEFGLIVNLLNKRLSKIKVLDLGNNPMGGNNAEIPEFRDPLVSHILQLDFCDIDTDVARQCLAMCEGQLDLSGNTKVDWRKLGGVDDTVRINELVATGCDLHLSDAFSKLTRLCCDRVLNTLTLTTGAVDMSALNTLSATIVSNPSRTWWDTITRKLPQRTEATMNSIADYTVTGNLSKLLLGGRTPDGEVFYSNLDHDDSVYFANVMQGGTCQLKVLGLSHCRVDAIKNLIASTLYLRNLQELYLASLNVNDYGIIGESLRALLSSSKVLKVLGLNDNHMSDNCVTDILQGVNENESLVMLHMDKVPVCEAMVTLHDSDGRHPLQLLELGNTTECQPTDPRFSPLLVESFTKFKSLRTLKCPKVVASADFDVKMMQTALRSLVSLKMLENLDLSNCHLDHICLSIVFDALRELPVANVNVEGNNSAEFTVLESILNCLHNLNSKIKTLNIKNVFSNMGTGVEIKIKQKLFDTFPIVHVLI